MYKFGILDAQYILVRNWHMLIRSETLTEASLLKSFIQSVVKLTRDYEISKPILLWDKYPYKRTEIIKQYKGDRYYPTEEEKVDLETSIKAETDPEKLKVLEQELETLTYKIEYERIKSSVKYYMIFKLGNLGFSSMIYTGYEADDLAYYVAQYLNKHESTSKHVLLTKDGDWKFFVNESVEYCRLNNKNQDVEYHTHSTIKDLFPVLKSLDISLIDFFSYHELWFGGHNNIGEFEGFYDIEAAWNKGMLFDEYITKCHAKIPIFSEEYQLLFNKFSEIINPTSLWTEKIDSIIYNVLYKSELIPSKFLSFCIEKGVDITPNYYDNYVKCLDRTLFSNKQG